MCRKLFAYGSQTEYWDLPNCVGWTRSGTEGYGGCAVVLTINQLPPAKGQDAKASQLAKRMRIGKPGEVWADVLGHVRGVVVIDQLGKGVFPTNGPGVSVFVRKDSPGVSNFPSLIDLNIYGP
jgi:alpha-amylase